MRTINDITLLQAQQIAQIENGESSMLNDDVKFWPLQQYLRIKNRVIELLENPLLCVDPSNVLATPKKKYTLDFKTDHYTNVQLETMAGFAKDYVGQLHFILAAIATPIPGRWFFSPDMSPEEKAADILKANFIDAYSACYHFLMCVRRSTTLYKIERLRDKVSGKPEAAELIETKAGMYVSLNYN